MKALYGRKRDSLKVPHEKDRYSVRLRSEKLNFQLRSMFRKGKVRSKVTPRKIGVWLNIVEELSKESWC